MRLSPSGRWFVMERGQHASDAPRRIEVVDAATGLAIAVFPSGYNPRWRDATWIVAEAPDGLPNEVVAGAFTVEYVPANRGQLDARGGFTAVSDLADTLFGDASGQIAHIDQAREPRIGVGLSAAVRHPGTGHLRFLSTPAAVWVDLGPCEDARWDAGTLVWWLAGRVWGRSTIDQPTTELTVPGRSCSHPAPLWTGSQLFVGLVLDAGELVVCEWGSLARGEALGWRVGVSDGSGFDWCLVPAGAKGLKVAYFDPFGVPVYASIDTSQPPVSLKPPVVVKPPVLPDQPFVVDPHGVVEDIAAWLFAPNQGPDVHLSPDGTIRFFCKSDEASGDGPGAHIGEHWDRDAQYIGHLDDASTGRRILNGKEVIAEDIVSMFPNNHAAVWASLPLNHNWFKDGARLWTTRRCVSGTRIHYVTDIIWTVPPRETPHTNVWKNIPIEIRVDVGHGVIHGKPVRVRSSYVPDGHAEVSYYGEPHGYNAWIAGPYATEGPEWMP